MNKLTHEEASMVIGEACRLINDHPYLRLGQAIWNCCGDALCRIDDSSLEHKLYVLLDSDTGTCYDFFYEPDTDKVIEVFYNRYVAE